MLVSGDLAETAADAEYAVVKAALDRLHVPAFVLPGNQDDRARLRAHFRLPGDSDAPVRYCAELPALSLLVLDSTVPGRDSGALSSEQLAWLDAELSRAPGQVALRKRGHLVQPDDRIWACRGERDLGQSRMTWALPNRRQPSMMSASA